MNKLTQYIYTHRCTLICVSSASIGSEAGPRRLRAQRLRAAQLRSAQLRGEPGVGAVGAVGALGGRGNVVVSTWKNRGILGKTKGFWEKPWDFR